MPRQKIHLRRSKYGRPFVAGSKRSDDYLRQAVAILENVKAGRRISPIESHVLKERGLIKAMWKIVPYIDKPDEMTKVFDGWELTQKGEHYLRTAKEAIMFTKTHRG